MESLADILARIQQRMQERKIIPLPQRRPACPVGKCDGSGVILHEDEHGRLAVEECAHVIAERQRRQAERLFEAGRIPARFRHATFESFDRSRQPAAYDAARRYVDEWEAVRREGRWLFLGGDVGTGKSHLAYAILQALLRRGVAGMAATVPDLLDELRPGRDDEADRLRVLKTVPLLVLDDLGAERHTEWVTERLFVILNARYADRLPTVITSNLRLQELEGITGWQRITDRILECAEIVHVKGESYRLETARERRNG